MKILVLGDFHGKFSDKLKKRLSKEDFDIVVGVGDYTGVEDWRDYFKVVFRLVATGKPRPTAEEFFGKKKYKQLLKKDIEGGKRVLSNLNKLGKPAIIIFGNGDDEWYTYPYLKDMKIKKSNLSFLKGLKNIKDITYSGTKKNGLSFLGFGGYMDVKANYKKKEKKDLKKVLIRVNKSRNNLLKRFAKSKPDIFVPHYPPEGIFDIIKDKGNPFRGKSAGIPAFREAILRYKPKLVLCGHMHEYQGAKKLGKSLVVNPGEGDKGMYAIVDWPSLKVKCIK